MIEKQYLSIHGFISNQKNNDFKSDYARVFFLMNDSKRPALHFDCIHILLMKWQMEKS